VVRSSDWVSTDSRVRKDAQEDVAERYSAV